VTMVKSWCTAMKWGAICRGEFDIQAKAHANALGSEYVRNEMSRRSAAKS